MQSELARKTLDLVRDRKNYGLSLREIAEGSGVATEWLRDVTYGRVDIHNAAVSRVEAVYNFLSKQTA